MPIPGPPSTRCSTSRTTPRLATVTCRPCSTTWDTAPRTMTDAAAYTAELPVAVAGLRTRLHRNRRAGPAGVARPGGRAWSRRRPGRLRHGPVGRRGQCPGGSVRRDDVRARPGGRERRVRRLRLHVAQPGAALVLLRPPRRTAPLHPRRLAGPAQPFSGVRRLVVLDDPSRPGRREGQPVRALPGRRPAPRPGAATAGAARQRGAPCPRPTATAGVPLRGLRRRRDRRRLRGRVRPGAQPSRGRLLPGRLPPGGRGARQAGSVHARPMDHPPRPLRLRLLRDVGPRPGRLGHPGRVRRGAADQRQLLPGATAGPGLRDHGRPAGALVGPAGHRRRLHTGRAGAARDAVCGSPTWSRTRAGSDRGGCPTASTSGRTSWRSART